MEFDIEDDASRTPELILETNEFLNRSCDIAQLLHELLTIECPSLDEETRKEGRHSAGEPPLPVSPAELKMVSRIGFVKSCDSKPGIAMSSELLLLDIRRISGINGSDKEEAILFVLENSRRQISCIG